MSCLSVVENGGLLCGVEEVIQQVEKAIGCALFLLVGKTLKVSATKKGTSAKVSQ